MADTMSKWESIREGANDVERLIGQKQYNLAMIKARQTLEIMVSVLASRYGMETQDLSSTIDELYRAGVLSRTSAEHYHKIRMIGNKAAHEADDNPTGANVAYHLLSQELYTFAHDYGNQRPVRRSSQRSARSGRDDDVRPAGSGRKKRSGGREKIFIVVAIILAVLLIIGIVKLIGDRSKKEVETQPETEMQIAIETAPPIPETVPEPETEPPTEAPKQYVISADTVNIREAPNTDCKILVQLHAGDPVNIIEDYDAEWAKIDLNGTEAYVNKQFIKAAEEPEEVPAEEAEPE